MNNKNRFIAKIIVGVIVFSMVGTTLIWTLEI